MVRFVPEKIYQIQNSINLYFLKKLKDVTFYKFFDPDNLQ